MRKRMRMKWVLLLGCLSMTLLLAPAVHAAEPVVMSIAGEASGQPLVAAEVMADHDAVAPGQTFTLGVRLTMRPGWHIYWRNPGDSGQATSIKVSTDDVEGLEVDDIRWPLPHRFELDGGLANLGYDGTVILSRQITLPDDLGEAEQITLTIDASWLVCEASCIPGSEKLTLSLPIAAKPAPANADIFAAHEATLPRTPDALSDRVSVRSRGGIDAADNAGAWHITLDWQGAAPAEVAWFPAGDDALMLDEPSVRTEAQTTTIQQPASKLAGLVPAADTLWMLVTWREPDGTRRGVEVPVPFFVPDETTNP